MDTGSGTSAAARLVATFARAGCAPPILVLGADGERVRAALGEPVLRACGKALVHEGWAAGQTSSLQAAVREMGRPGSEAAAFFIAPVDRPFVRVETIAAMMQALIAGRDGAVRVVIPLAGGRRGHPVLCDRSLSEEFLFLAPDEPAHRVTRRDPGRVLELPLDDPGVTDNLDTEEALAEAVRRETAGNR